MKKVLISAILIVLIPTLLFIPVYALMVYTIQTGVRDYSSDIQGVWCAFQYYHESERFVCDEDHFITFTFTEDTLTIDSTIIESVDEVKYHWINGASFSYEGNESETTFLVDFDTQNNLKISEGKHDYIILLRKEE